MQTFANDIRLGVSGEKMSVPEGSVFDIQRFSLHDGPGIRTLVFLKGCPLSCVWCCNPESQKEAPQIGYNAQKCISCNACVEACPYDAVSFEEGERLFSMSICDSCREQPCVEACPSGAIERFGTTMTVEEVMREVRRDEPFYRKSGGGLTVSGGEPMAQAEFTAAILKAGRGLGYSTAVETSGFCGWEEFEKIIEFTDLFLFDIKHMDSEKHREFIGQGNSRILENLARLRLRSPNIIVRIPLVPGFNSDGDSVSAIADFVRENGIPEIHILPYHRLGRSKYGRLFRAYAAEDIEIPMEEEIEAARQIIESRHIRVLIGG
jgi:pyruvate formate lyase activating enzyme